MPPKPVRGPTRRASGVLPETQQLTFLLEASALLGQSCPQLAALLGRRALQVGDSDCAVMPRGAAAALCARCGLPFTEEVYQSGQVVRLPRHYVKRKLQAAERGAAQQPGGKLVNVNRAAVLYSCKLCGYNTVRPFYTAAAAYQAVQKAGGAPPPLLYRAATTPATQHAPSMTAASTAAAAAAAAAAELLPSQPWEHFEQSQPELACAPDVPVGSVGVIAKPLAEAAPAGAAAALCAHHAVQATAELAVLLCAVQGRHGVSPAPQCVQSACLLSHAPMVTAELAAAQPPAQPLARLEAAAVVTSDQPSSPHLLSTARPPQGQRAVQEQEGAAEDSVRLVPGSSAPRGMAVTVCKEATAGAGLLPQQQRQEAKRGAAEAPALGDEAASTTAASVVMLQPVEREAEAADVWPGQGRGQPAECGESAPASAVAGPAWDQGTAAPWPPAAAGTDQPAPAAAHLPSSQAAVVGRLSPAASSPMPALASERERQQQLKQKKRRISWSPHLEDVQLIPAAWPLQQHLGWVAGAHHATDSSVGEGRLVRRKAWFRLGRRWKCAGL